MLNIVIPMAGRGSRFANAGYTVPKPLIPLGGKPMIQWVIENVRPKGDHRFIFVCLQEHLERYPKVPKTLRILCPGCEIVPVKAVTEGAACTVLLARELIDSQSPLMIANSDQYVELRIDDYLATMQDEGAAGLIMTFWSDHPKWSYCRMAAGGTVAEVVEKKVVSNEATVGIYNFAHGADFVCAADAMIRNDLRVNGEFYVAPVYNMLIEQGKQVVVARIGREFEGMYGLGLPEDALFFRTTSLFRDSAIDRGELGEMTRAYVWAFNSKNMAALAGLLAENIVLIDPSGRFEGRTEVLTYIGGLFAEHGILAFSARRILVDGPVSVIEFDLALSEKPFSGTDVLEWKDGQIVSLTAHLSPSPVAS